MEFGIDDIKKKINNYFLGELSKEEVGEWAKAAYYDLLKGGYLETKKIMCYPFVKVISTFHIEEDDIRDVFPCSIEKVEFIRDVLNGKKNESYSIDIGILWKINCEKIGLNERKKAQYFKLRSILNQYSNKQTFTKDDYKECINALNMREDRPGTIQSILDVYIKSFLKNSIDCEEECLDFHQGMGLYILKRKNENHMLKKVINYLECYIGEINVCVDILFISGVPYLTFST